MSDKNEPTAVFGGPIFESANSEHRFSIHAKAGGHYNTYAAKTGLALLRNWFPTGKEANEMNFVLFSTSGVHGTYVTIEQIEHSLKKYPDVDDDDEDCPKDYYGNKLTFLLVQPRLVSLTYGNATVTLDDIPYLKTLRAASFAVVQKIGVPK